MKKLLGVILVIGLLLWVAGCGGGAGTGAAATSTSVMDPAVKELAEGMAGTSENSQQMGESGSSGSAVTRIDQLKDIIKQGQNPFVGSTPDVDGYYTDPFAPAGGMTMKIRFRDVGGNVLDPTQFGPNYQGNSMYYIDTKMTGPGFAAGETVNMNITIIQSLIEAGDQYAGDDDEWVGYFYGIGTPGTTSYIEGMTLPNITGTHTMYVTNTLLYFQAVTENGNTHPNGGPVGGNQTMTVTAAGETYTCTMTFNTNGSMSGTMSKDGVLIATITVDANGNGTVTDSEGNTETFTAGSFN